MDLVVLGSSGTYPAPHAPASGYLVTASGTAIWCDAGPGTFQPLAAIIAPERLSAVVLSHLHPDHCSDLFSLFHYLAYGPPGGAVTVDVYAPPGAATRFEAFLEPSRDSLFYDVVRFPEVMAGSVIEIGDIAVRFAAAHHSVPAFLVRFDTAAGSIVYTGDTGPTPELTALAAGTDLLVAEASLGPDEDPWPFHMTPAQAGEYGAAAGASRLLLTHLRPTLDPVAAVDAATATYGREPQVATPGLTITI